WREMRSKNRPAQTDRIAVVQHAIDGMRLPAGPDIVQCRDILCHRHNRRTCELLHERIACHVVGMRVAAEQNLDVRKLETEFLDSSANYRNRFLVITINKDVTLGRRDQERAQLFRTDEIHVADDLVWRKRLIPIDSRNGVASHSTLSSLG